MWLLTKFGSPVPWSKEEVQVYVAKMKTGNEGSGDTRICEVVSIDRLLRLRLSVDCSILLTTLIAGGFGQKARVFRGVKCFAINWDKRFWHM